MEMKNDDEECNPKSKVELGFLDVLERCSKTAYQSNKSLNI